MEKRKKNIVELTRVTMDDYRKERKLPLKIVVDSVRSMNNIGSIFRTSDAFLIDEIILCGISSTPPHPEIHKTALGAEDSVAWRYAESAVEIVKELRSQGVKVCCLEQTHNSVPLHQFRPSPDEVYAIVVGNEVEGVAQEVVDNADTVLEIPQFGTKHSLNAAVSAGLALWHFLQSLHLRP